MTYYEQQDFEDDLYERLELTHNCTQEEIRLAFRRFAKKYHPDTNAGKDASDEIFRRIRTAYELLSEESFRKNYDFKIQQRLDEKKKKEIRTKCEGIDIATKLEIILAWSTTKKAFNPSFASSCVNRLAEGGTLSQRQKEAVDNILSSFKIDIDFWLQDENREAGLSLFMDA